MRGVVGNERKIERGWDTSQQAKCNAFSEKGTLFLCFICGPERGAVQRGEQLAAYIQHPVFIAFVRGGVCYGKAGRNSSEIDVTIHYADNGPSLESCMVAILNAHLSKSGGF